MKCEYATELTDERKRIECSLHKRTNSLGVCHGCGDNTAKGEWPDFTPTVPVRVIRSSVDAQATQKHPQPIPPDKWPSWANWLAGHRGGEDKGVGDTFKRMLGVGGKLFEIAFLAIYGKHCGCSERRHAWNQLYPYSVQTELNTIKED